MNTLPYSKITRLIALILLIVSTNCTVKLVADYDADLVKQIEETNSKIDKFYLSMAETPFDTLNRAYSNFKEGYVDIETDLSSMLNKNRVKALNSDSERIAEIALEFWQEYKIEHKNKIIISDGTTRSNRLYMRDIFYAFQVAEEAKKIKAANPEEETSTENNEE